jgi:cyanophycinase
MRFVLAFVSIVLLTGCEESQPVSISSKGKLFIIGGGDRTPELMNNFKRVAHLEDGSVITVLPMAGEEPDSSFYYFQKDIPPQWGVKCLNLNFSDPKVDIENLKSILRQAKTIFICGGAQLRFMEVIARYNLQPILTEVYMNGATIAGTSAGAAVMSEKMITGNQKTDTAYSATYTVVQKDNGIYSTGLGFIKEGIIDQHFIVRSRYNRLLSAQLDFPLLWGLGIDESTAAVFYQDSVEVVGQSYVIYFAPLKIDSVATPSHFNSTTTYYRSGEKFRLTP